jgi:pimeloyl-ACP methyl ester carboxylesterase
MKELMARDDLTIEEILASLIPTQWIQSHPEIWEYYPTIRKISDQDCSDRHLNAFETWTGCFSGLKNIASPTLIIGGESDQVCPVDNAILLNLEIARSRMVLFSGAGHGLMYQMPEELAETVDDFLGGRKFTRKA